MSAFALWRLFHRPGSRGSAGHTSVLAIIAFAAATTIFLTVLGGVHGFMWRASADHTIGCAINLDACKPGTAEIWKQRIANPHSLDQYATAYVVLAFFACLLLIVQIIDYGRFQTAEAEFIRLVQTCYRKINSMVIAAQCQALNFRTSGIRQPHNTGNLVEGFACRIITRLSQKLKAVIAGNLQQGRVSAADNQRHKRRLQLAVCQKVGKYMAFKMVDTYQRFVRCPRPAPWQPKDRQAARQPDQVRR